MARSTAGTAVFQLLRRKTLCDFESMVTQGVLMRNLLAGLFLLSFVDDLIVVAVLLYPILAKEWRLLLHVF
jgi:hypothetical protein